MPLPRPTHRLLVTARDPAAAYHLTEVVRCASGDPRFEVRAAAQEPAWGLLRRGGVEVQPLPDVKTRDPFSPSGIRLRALARTLLEEFEPDAVLCGLSTPFDGGIDEAVLAEARVPTFLLQDFWGEQNDLFGRRAELFLVLDEMAAELSWRRHGAPSAIVGSPRHATYRSIDGPARRRDVRRALSLRPDVPVIGLFGQALHKLPGYRRTVEAWAAAMAAFPSPVVAAYRPHPRESEADRRHTLELLRGAELGPICVLDLGVEDALLCCDVVCSAFSNCTYDAAYLNYFASQPLIVPLCLFFDPEVVEYFQQIVRLAEWPYLKSDLALPIHEAGHLRDALVEAVGRDARHRFWQAARQNLISPVGSPQRVLDVVDQALHVPLGPVQGPSLSPVSRSQP